MAAGFYYDGSHSQPLTMSWDTLVWTAENPAGPGIANILNSVSCASASFCSAVGYSEVSITPTYSTLAMNWTPSGGWVVKSSPNTGAITFLESVSCTSDSFCTAVGSFFDGAISQAFAMTWSSGSWTDSSPSPGTSDNFLTSVSCTGPTSCTAVGNYYSYLGVNQTLAMSWSSVTATWTVVTSPNSTVSWNYLVSVSCKSDFCAAVGRYNLTTHDQTLAMTKSAPGAWTLATSPNRDAIDNQMTSVSCIGASFCMAVGYYYDPAADAGAGADQPLAMTWNGSTWSIVATPTPSPAVGAYLESVSCVSDTSCVAVGTQSFHGDLTSYTLALEWDGNTDIWTDIVSDSPGHDDYLYSVSCVGTVCIAVGSSQTTLSGAYETLALKWDLSTNTWTNLVSPSQGLYDNLLNSVSCVSTTVCTAVGSYWTPDPADPSPIPTQYLRTLAMTWTQSGGWTIATSPNSGTGFITNELKSVSCTSASFCVAVGDFYEGGIQQKLTMTWNGLSWTNTTPSSAAANNSLDSVSCASENFCTAVGYYIDTTVSLEKTLVMTWEGYKNQWSTSSSDNIATVNNGLQSVSCVSVTSCTAVGQYYASAKQTLALAIVPPPAFVVPAAPTSLVATVGNTTVSIAFTPGAAGDAAITKYQYTTNDGSSWADVTSVGTSSPVTISGLTNYVDYSIKLRAFSTYGGAASTAVSVETKNAAPTFTTAYSGRVNGYAFRGILAAYTRVTPPTGTMVSYQITAYARGTNTVVSSCTAKATWERCFIYGLTTGTQYDVRVKGLLKLPATPLVTRTTLESNYVTIRV